MINDNYLTNNHLSFFNFFREDKETPEIIENNLSRALAICLSREPVLFDGFIKAIAPDDYDKITMSNDPVCKIDIQINTKNLPVDEYNKVYAVALTSKDFKNILEEFENLSVEDDQANTVTDIIIEINDVLFVIEVKPSEENCLYQLKKQVLHFLPKVQPASFSWLQVIELMQQKQNILRMTGNSSFYIDSFISLIEQRFFHWIPTKPFHFLPINNPQVSPDINKRLKLVLEHCSNSLVYYPDRISISVDFDWASEVIPKFQQIDDQFYLTINIWPGNTKGQGEEVYDEKMDWLLKKEIIIAGKAYPLKIEYEVKFCHYNRYVCNLEFSDEDDCLLKPLHTLRNYYYSGKKDRGNDNWKGFVKFMDEHFRAEYKWMDKCGFQENFIDTNRKYFTVSFGFIVYAMVPYSLIMELDKKQDDYIKVSALLDAAVESFKSLI